MTLPSEEQIPTLANVALAALLLTLKLAPDKRAAIVACLEDNDGYALLDALRTVEESGE